MIGKLWLALAVVVGVGAAYMYQYEPILDGAGAALHLYDRWGQRVCVVLIAADNNVICTMEELSNLGK